MPLGLHVQLPSLCSFTSSPAVPQHMRYQVLSICIGVDIVSSSPKMG